MIYRSVIFRVLTFLMTASKVVPKFPVPILQKSTCESLHLYHQSRPFSDGEVFTCPVSLKQHRHWIEDVEIDKTSHRTRPRKEEKIEPLVTLSHIQRQCQRIHTRRRRAPGVDGFILSRLIASSISTCAIGARLSGMAPAIPSSMDSDQDLDMAREN